MRPNPPIVPFHEAAGPTRRKIVAEFSGNDSCEIRVLDPVVGYLHSLHIATHGTYEYVRVTETNGQPLIMISRRSLAAIGDPHVIPIAINGKGLGGLPDMSSASAYRMQLDRLTAPAVITAEYWPLPDVQNPVSGVAQAQTPPHCGTVAYLTDFTVTPEEDGTLKMWRTGNYLLFLAVLINQPVFRATLFRDEARESSVLERSEKYVIWDSQERPTHLPTLTDTVMTLREIDPPLRPHEPVTWVCRDMATWVSYGS